MADHRLLIVPAALVLTAAGSNGQVSPQILGDGRVTFRCKASRAEEVKVAGQFGPAVVCRTEAGGVWEGTTADPVPPGIYEYHFMIDGRRTLDSRNSEIKPQRWPGSSILHIPATPPAPWDLQDIPHGIIHHHVYHSGSLEQWRDLVVYTPPADSSTFDPMPVLYLAHGFSDNQRTWTVHGKAHWILDALIHSAKAEPMMIVMPDAHAIDPAGKSENYGKKNTLGFCTDLVEDVIPFIEEHYQVRQDRSMRAFAGLSMGGGHALALALRHSELFAYIGAFSSATPSAEFVDETGGGVSELNKNLELLWVACGDKDFLYERNQEMHAEFERLGIDHDYHITEGDNHSWPVWRRYLVEFVPRLFK